MNEILKDSLDISGAQSGDEMILAEGGAALLEMWVEAAEAGKFGDQYSAEDIERTRQRAADIRLATMRGSSEEVGLD